MREASVRKTLRHGVVAAVLGALAVTASAEQVKNNKAMDVLSDKNPFADPVESVPASTSMEKLGEEGSWVKVRTPSGKTGYVTSDDVTPPKNLDTLAANASATNAQAAAAGRGLDEEAKQFAANKHLTLDGYKAMLAAGNSVSRQDVRDFGKTGNVGPSKYRSK